MKRMIILAAAVALSGVLPTAPQAKPASPRVAVASDAAKAKEVAKDAKAKDQPQPLAKPATPKKVPAASVKLWVDWQTGSLDARYRFVDTSVGKVTSDSIQHKQAFKAGLKFDKAGRYSVQTLTGTGSSFTGSWDNLGPGWATRPGPSASGSCICRRSRSRASRAPGAAWPSLAASTPRSRQRQLHHGRPRQREAAKERLLRRGLSDRGLAAKKLGKKVSISADWTDLNQVATWRQAVRVSTKEWMPIDAIRFENYQRTEGTTGYGFSVSAERTVHKRVLLAGGFANIDENNGTLSGDRYFRGKRFFVEPKITILPELNLSVFYTQAFDNDFSVVNQHRFDLVLSYNVLKALQKAGAW